MSRYVDRLLSECVVGGSPYAPRTIDQIQERLHRIETNECRCGASTHENALHDLAADDVPALIRLVDLLARKLEETRP